MYTLYYSSSVSLARIYGVGAYAIRLYLVSVRKEHALKRNYEPGKFVRSCALAQCFRQLTKKF